MYQQFFSLNKQPFSIAPDPDFLFFTEQHKEALAHLTYGLQGNGGFVVLTGEVGTGKTTICRFLLQDMPADTDIASITNTAVSEIELLVDICNQFNIDYDRQNISLKEMFDALASWMLSNHLLGRHAIVLIDEAQHLSFKVLEQLRLITNIESDNQKPLQIILIGQTELQEKLLTVELRQLSQRITARYHLLPLNKQETTFYLHHRLNTAGSKEPIFSPKAIPIIFKASRGIPKLINQIADRCLLSAFTAGAVQVTPQLAKKAILETELPKQKSKLSPYAGHLISIFAVVLISFIINAKAPQLLTYLKDSENKALEEEWLKVLDNVNNQEAAPALKSVESEPVSAQSKPTDLKPDLQSDEIVLTPAGTILAMPSMSYTLQLAALPSIKSLQRFFSEHPNLKGKTYIYRGLRNNNPKYVVLLGTFNTYKMSKRASKEFVKRYPDISPWIKNFSAVHDDFK